MRDAGMDQKEIWEARVGFLNNVREELSATVFSYRAAVNPEGIKTFRSLDGVFEKKQAKKQKRVAFSQFYHAIRGKIRIDEGTNPNLLDAWIENDEYLDKITAPDFQFNEESFPLIEFDVIVELYKAVGPEGDPRVELAVMKALFHGGEIVERLKHEGQAKSDRPIKAGSHSWKKKPSHEDIVEMAKSMRSDMTLTSKAEHIEKKLKGELPEGQAYDKRSIYRILKNNQ
jgi:hypothetical protein